MLQALRVLGVEHGGPASARPRTGRGVAGRGGSGGSRQRLDSKLAWAGQRALYGLDVGLNYLFF
jgi:hypothetical protein